MAELDNTNPTLLDVIKRTDPDSQIATIVEALSERNPILQDATAMEGNLPTGHRVTIRDGLPTVSWRRINEGITGSKSTTIQVDETCGMLEGRSDVDTELAALSGNVAAFRQSEDIAFLQSLNIEMADALFYSNVGVNPEQIHGFSPRYSALTGGSGENVLDVSSAPFDSYSPTPTGIRSIWFITWGPTTTYMLYPRGSQVGIQMRNLGEDYVQASDWTAASRKEFLAYRTHFKWKAGLCVKDWRYNVRIANIDLDSIAVTSSKLMDAMIEAYHRIHDLQSGRTVCYMSREVLAVLDRSIYNKSNLEFSPMEWHGRPVTGFRGIPIVSCDALANDETAVT